MKIILGDCVAVMAGMEPESVHAIVTDPPYLLQFMGKTWDSPTQNLMGEWHQQWAEAAYRVPQAGARAERADAVGVGRVNPLTIGARRFTMPSVAPIRDIWACASSGASTDGQG